MRGFTMLLVVYHHVILYGYEADHLSSDIASFNEVFLKFRMPLFFFISGWVLYKGSRVWDKKTSLSFLANKFKVQIISTAIILMIYQYLFQPSMERTLGTYKSGYWFTYTLFFFFVFYVLSARMARFFKNHWGEDLTVIVITLIVVLAAQFVRYDMNMIHIRYYGYIGVYNWNYYFFFCFGTLVRKYSKSFVKMTDKGWVMAAVISVFFLLMAYETRHELAHFRTPSFFVYGFLGIVIVYTLFRKSEGWFAEDHRISRWMQYIGRHTLDIYLLHYFFLPRRLQFVGDFFKANPNPTIELFVSMTLALMVVAVCLITSKVICTSPTLGNLLFGKKK